MKINWDKAQKVFNEQESEPIDKSSQATVLVVDDEAPNLTLYRAALEQRFNVLTAQSGDEALTVINQQDIHVVVTDHRMPKMTGMQLCRELKKRQHAAPRIIITGYADLQGVISAVNEAGIFRYVTKPVNRESLNAVVDAAVTENTVVEENRRLLALLKDILEENSELHKENEILGGSMRRETPLNVMQEPKRIRVGILMLDVRGFTQLSASSSPGDIFGLLQELFSPIHRIIYDCGGIVDKHMGDGLMAVFGLAGGDPTGPSLRAAKNIADAFPPMVQNIAGGQYADLRLSIGVTTGDVILGTIGSERRSELAVIGRPPNLASRLQDFTKHALAHPETSPLGSFPHVMVLSESELVEHSDFLEHIDLGDAQVRDFLELKAVGLYRT
jgi:adenylate cyclase